MTAESNDIPIEIEATDRRSFLMNIVEGLREILPVDAGIATDGAMLEPWQVTTPTFDELPERLIMTLMDKWNTSDTRCVDLEMQGYLETDAGPRVWGLLSMQADILAPATRVELTGIRYSETAGQHRVEARAVTSETTDA